MDFAHDGGLRALEIRLFDVSIYKLLYTTLVHFMARLIR